LARNPIIRGGASLPTGPGSRPTEDGPVYELCQTIDQLLLTYQELALMHQQVGPFDQGINPQCGGLLEHPNTLDHPTPPCPISCVETSPA
jgi:hypothetical protein